MEIDYDKYLKEKVEKEINDEWRKRKALMNQFRVENYTFEVFLKEKGWTKEE